MEGYVFDIQRFAIHDGQGIRTTIFLKGCPLHCVWCQNPEGIHPTPQVLYMENRCIHCHQCLNVCVHQGITIHNQALQIHREAKEDWDALLCLCPSVALRYDSTCYTSKEVVREAIKDKAFFHYGGGVTISGGEPFYQHEFMLDILKQLKENGIHTTIETSLFVDQEILKKALPYIDNLYVDIKFYDTYAHKRFTGVDNSVILDNVLWLLNSERKEDVIIRTPLIPNRSATKSNIQSIAQFITNEYEQVTYELLNYNPLAKAKYQLLGKTYCFQDNPKLYSEQEMALFYQYARDAGIRHLIVNTKKERGKK